MTSNKATNTTKQSITKLLTLDQIHAMKGSATSRKEAYLLAAQIIETPGRWTKRASARDEYQRPVYFGEDTATCWCVYGAINMVGQCRFLTAPELVIFNDTSDSPTPVVDLLRKLAEDLK